MLASSSYFFTVAQVILLLQKAFRKIGSEMCYVELATLAHLEKNRICIPLTANQRLKKGRLIFFASQTIVVSSSSN